MPSPSIDERGQTEQRWPRMLLIQSSSIFEQYGGIESYQDDLLLLWGEILGSKAVGSVIPDRGSLGPIDRPYATWKAGVAAGGIKGKWSNRFGREYFRSVETAATALKPNFLVCGHISLAPLTLILSRRLRIPFLSIAYGIESWGQAGSLLSRCSPMGLVRGLEELAFAQSHGFISISEWTREILSKRGVDSKRVVVIHPRLPALYERIQPRPDRRDDGVLRLLTVSRLNSEEAYKGQDHVIEALARIRKTQPNLRIEYTIVGDGRDISRLKQRSVSCGVDKLVRFEPGVKHRDELLDKYHHHDVFIMPSRYGHWGGRWRGEGFGIVYVEAAACGLPTIAYRCGGVMDIVEHGHSGLLAEPDNIEDLARQISELAASPERLHQLSNNARKNSIDRFSGKSITREILDSFKTLSAFSPR